VEAMQIRFFKPFDEITGAGEVHLHLEKSVSVRELLDLVEKKFPSFGRYVRKEGDEVQNFFVILVRGDEILKLNDAVGDEDVIKVLPPISGG
jgi:MoaD family protein